MSQTEKTALAFLRPTCGLACFIFCFEVTPKITMKRFKYLFTYHYI